GRGGGVVTGERGARGDRPSHAGGGGPALVGSRRGRAPQGHRYPGRSARLCPRARVTGLSALDVRAAALLPDGAPAPALARGHGERAGGLARDPPRLQGLAGRQPPRRALGLLSAWWIFSRASRTAS